MWYLVEAGYRIAVLYLMGTGYGIAMWYLMGTGYGYLHNLLDLSEAV